jgi:hypothetical protein
MARAVHEKARRAQQAGAVALVVVNTSYDGPCPIGGGFSAADLVIPSANRIGLARNRQDPPTCLTGKSVPEAKRWSRDLVRADNPANLAFQRFASAGQRASGC